MRDPGRSTPWRPAGALGWSLVLGAAYDLGFAALATFAPALVARWFALPLPPVFYLRVLAALLAMVAALYLVAATAPARHRGIVAVAIGGRLLGALALGGSAWSEPSWAGLWPLAGGDLGFALAHALAWRGGMRSA